MPGVSIALATFNGEKYLASQLESLAAQIRLPFELVVSDDCSDDRTVELVSDFAKRAPFPVRIVSNESRLGYADNFMRAVEHCKADIVAFSDQDDIWEPNKLAVMERLFDDPDVMLAYHNASVIDENAQRIGDLYKPGGGVHVFPPLALEPWSLVAGFTQVFRRRLSRFSALRTASRDPYWPTEHLAHDQWYLLLASVFGSVVRVGEPLARYRQHGGNRFGWENKRSLEAAPGHFLRGDRFVAAAKNRSELLHAMSAGLTVNETARVRDAIAFYDDLHRRLDDRMAVYASPALSTRAKAFHALLRRNAYGRARASARFGWKGLLMDAFGGVLCGPIVKRFFQ